MTWTSLVDWCARRQARALSDCSSCARARRGALTLFGENQRLSFWKRDLSSRDGVWTHAKIRIPSGASLCLGSRHAHSPNVPNGCERARGCFRTQPVREPRLRTSSRTRRETAVVQPQGNKGGAELRARVLSSIAASERSREGEEDGGGAAAKRGRVRLEALGASSPRRLFS